MERSGVGCDLGFRGRFQIIVSGDRVDMSNSAGS